MQSLFSRFLSLFRVDMSNNQLRSRLQKALKEVEKEFCFVEDEDLDKGVVVYGTWDYDYNDQWWQRTFTLDSNGFPVLNDDKQPVEPVKRYEVIPVDPPEAPITANVNANAGCSCHKGDPDPMATLKEKLIAQITARPRNKFTPKALSAMDDDALLAADEMSREDDKDKGTTNPDGTMGDGGKSTPTPAANPLPSDNPKTEVHPVPPEEQIRAQSKTITLTAENYLILKAQADAQVKIENDRKEALLQTLSGVMKVTDGIKALPLVDLEALAESYNGIAGGISFDFTASRVVTASSGTDSDMPKGWEGYSTPDTYGLRAQSSQSAQKKGAN